MLRAVLFFPGERAYRYNISLSWSYVSKFNVAVDSYILEQVSVVTEYAIRQYCFERGITGFR